MMQPRNSRMLRPVKLAWPNYPGMLLTVYAAWVMQQHNEALTC